jgi:predicted DNA binding CopG/RHH family protein
LKRLKQVPDFDSEETAGKFWAKTDSTEYLDWSKAKAASFPDLKPSNRVISIRLPEFLLQSIKVLANRQDVPYQSMLKMLLAEKVREIFSSSRSKKTA